MMLTMPIAGMLVSKGDPRIVVRQFAAPRSLSST